MVQLVQLLKILRRKNKMNFDEYNVRLQEIIKKLESNDVSVEEVSE